MYVPQLGQKIEAIANQRPDALPLSLHFGGVHPILIRVFIAKRWP